MKQPTPRIEQPINTIETERQECLDFIITVKKSVLETFPFTTDDEKTMLEDKFDALLNDDNYSATDIINNIKLILASLENTHTLLKEEKKDAYYPEKPIFYKAGKYWVENDNQILEIININGLDINDLIQQKIKEFGGGTIDYKINGALHVLMSDFAHTAVLKVKNEENQTFNLKINYVNTKEIAPSLAKEEFVDSKMLDEDTGYLKIDSWSNRVNIDGKNISDLVEDNLRLLTSAKSLIIDVRNNGGGDSQLAEKLAGHFITQPVAYGTAFIREPGHNTLISENFYLQPRGDYLDKKLVILTGPKCLSSNEMFIMMLKDTNRAITVGQTTGGGSGNPKSFNIHLGKRNFTLNVATWRMQRNNGSPLENIGIEPDLPVITTPHDVVQHQDPDLKRAIEYVHYSEKTP